MSQYFEICNNNKTSSRERSWYITASIFVPGTRELNHSKHPAAFFSEQWLNITITKAGYTGSSIALTVAVWCPSYLSPPVLNFPVLIKEQLVALCNRNVSRGKQSRNLVVRCRWPNTAKKDTVADGECCIRCQMLQRGIVLTKKAGNRFLLFPPGFSAQLERNPLISTRQRRSLKYFKAWLNPQNLFHSTAAWCLCAKIEISYKQ